MVTDQDQVAGAVVPVYSTRSIGHDQGTHTQAVKQEYGQHNRVHIVPFVKMKAAGQDG